MEKIPFSDGVRTSRAKVTIDGVDYIVTPATYSGSTPLSAYIMNRLQTNIENAINQNADNIGGEEYDDTATYEEGDIVTYEGQLYVCIEAVETAEEFDNTKWQEITLTNEVNKKQEKLISGVNIKTINNVSILGSGNISTETSIIDLVYPVGSVYMSVSTISPATLFGGTWEQIKDKFLLSAGDTYNAGDTGGEASHILTTDEMPSHTHTFTGTAHHHTYSKSNTPTGGPSTNTTGSTALTIAQMPAHDHNVIKSGVTNSNLIMGAAAYNKHAGAGVATAAGDKWIWNKGVPAQGGGEGHTHTLSNHTHTISTTSTNTGDTTAGGTNSNTGGGQAHNNMPPYLAVYMWKRTA